MFFRGFAPASRAAMHTYALPAGLVVLILLCLPGLPALGQEWGEPTEECFKLTASDGAASDYFGRSVSISGETLVVGAIGAGDTVGNSGSAYVFRFDAVEWVEEQEIAASDAAGGDRFARSVSISGECLVVGAEKDDDDGVGSGSAYVFRFADTGEWVEEQKLTASDGAEGAAFGRSVSIAGECLVVGAWGSDSGSAYVFRFDADSEEWVEEQKLTASDGAAGDMFGWSVSISGECLVVGAWGDDDNGSKSGSAYVFRFEPDTEEWLEEQKLTASDGEEGDWFGLSVSTAGECLVAGAYGDDDDGSDSGSAYVFRFDPDTEEWVEEQKLTASDGAENDLFGESVSISGERLVVGALLEDEAGSRSGSAYVFQVDADTKEWVEEQKLTASDGGVEHRFGRVSISGETLVVGATGTDDNGSLSGSAYVFDIVVCDLVFEFARGDANNSGDVSAIPDALYLLKWGFTDGPEPECAAAADADGNGILSGLIDPLYLLRWQFEGGDEPPDPGPDECGPDPDDAECEVPPACP